MTQRSYKQHRFACTMACLYFAKWRLGERNTNHHSNQGIMMSYKIKPRPNLGHRVKKAVPGICGNRIAILNSKLTRSYHIIVGRKNSRYPYFPFQSSRRLDDDEYNF